MIIDLDPFFPASQSFATQLPSLRRPLSHTSSGARLGARARGRLEREASFERAHGSLWVRGLLDGLRLPLSRIHE